MVEIEEDGPVQFQIVNLAGDVPGARRIPIGVRVRREQILVGAGRDAYCPSGADVLISGLEVQIVVEDLRAVIAAIRDIDIAFGVSRDPVRQAALAGFLPGFLAAHLLEKPAVLVVLHHSIVTVSIRDENVSLWIPGNIGRTAERILLAAPPPPPPP